MTERQTWTRKIDFIFVTLSMAVGLSNIWRFPYLCYKNGGGAFLIPYCLWVIVCGIPMFFMEISMGQLSRSGPVRCWKLVPLFRGIGISSTLCIFFSAVYYIMLIAWALFYMIQSFQSPLPWTICDQPWISNTSMSCEGNNSASSLTEEFWQNRVLQLSSGLSEIGTLNFEMALCLAICWIICALCVSKGIKSAGPAAWFFGIFPYVVLTALLVRAVTLPGAIDGIMFYIRPNFSRLTDLTVWVDACFQVMISYGVCIGLGISLGSFNATDNRSYRDSIIICVANSLTSIFAGFAVFGFIGFMAHEAEKTIEEVTTTGPDLAFLTYPRGLAMMPWSSFWSAMFFLMLICIGIGSQLTYLIVLTTVIYDQFPKLESYKMLTSFGVSLLCFMVGIAMCTPGGFYIFQILERYGCSSFVLFHNGFWQCIAIGWLFGAHKFRDAIREATGETCSTFFTFCWRFITPCVTFSLLIIAFREHQTLTYPNGDEFEWWAQVTGWVIVACGGLLVPGHMIIGFLGESGSFGQRLKKLVSFSTDSTYTQKILKKDFEISSLDSSFSSMDEDAIDLIVKN